MGNITSKNNSKAVAKVIHTLHARIDLDPDPKVTKKNLSVSTISIGAILAITLAGAEGNTAQELMDALEVTRDEVDDLLNSFRAAIRDLKKVKVKLANKVIIKEDYEVKKTYIKTVKKAFEAHQFAYFMEASIDDLDFVRMFFKAFQDAIRYLKKVKVYMEKKVYLFGADVNHRPEALRPDRRGGH